METYRNNGVDDDHEHAGYGADDGFNACADGGYNCALNRIKFESESAEYDT